MGSTTSPSTDPARTPPGLCSRRLPWLARAGIVLFTLLLTYYAWEAVWRIRVRRNLSRQWPASLNVMDGPLRQFDALTGYRYVPNARLNMFTPDGQTRDNIALNPLHINNAGLRSLRDFQREKPAGEFRIAVIGNSFSACVQIPIPWPDYLHKVLNEDKDLLRALNCSSINVLNFARDGVSFPNFAAIARHEVPLYTPDLVLVCFLSDSTLGKFTWADTFTRDTGAFKYGIGIFSWSSPPRLSRYDSLFGELCVDFKVLQDKTKLSLLWEDLGRVRALRIPWFSPYPEFLASRLNGRFGLKPYLFADWVELSMETQTEEILRRTVGHMKEIAALHDRTFFVHIPQGPESPDMPKPFGEMTPGYRPPTLAALRRECPPSVRIATLLDFSPPNPNPEELQARFIRGDGHFTDHGAQACAEGVQHWLRAMILKHQLDTR